MAKILVCEKCKREKCDGILYKIKGDKSKFTFCENDENAFWKNGVLMYHYIMGHGNEWNEIAEKIG